MIEMRALTQAKVRAFVFTGKNVTGPDLANIILRALPGMDEILATTRPPFIARVIASGDVEVIQPKTGRKS